MTYDFDEIIDRKHTNALNTDGFRGYIFHDFEGKKTFPFKDDEFVRMWVASRRPFPPRRCPCVRRRYYRRL